MSNTIRVIQITDTHLSPERRHFVPNFEKIVDAVNAEQPHLVVNTGDVSTDGPDSDAELDFAARAHRRIDAPVLAVPGNHDVGDEPPGQPRQQYVNKERLARWRRYFDRDYWAVSVGAWRLIGLNTLLMGSGLEDEEQAQWDWLAQELREARDRPVGVFQHKPPFREDPGSTIDDFRHMVAAARARYAELLTPSSVRFLTCGHTHVHRRMSWLGRDVYWGPPTSAIEDAVNGPNAYPGYTRFDFVGDTVSVRFVFPLECELIDFNDANAALAKTGVRL